MKNTGSPNVTSIRFDNVDTLVHTDTLPIDKLLISDKKAKYYKHDIELLKRITRAKKVRIDNVFFFDDRIYIFLLRGNLVILDIEKLLVTCTCLDYNITSYRRIDYCKHILHCTDWLIDNKDKIVKINGRQFAEMILNRKLKK